jgi:hypothetical protein
LDTNKAQGHRDRDKVNAYQQFQQAVDSPTDSQDGESLGLGAGMVTSSRIERHSSDGSDTGEFQRDAGRTESDSGRVHSSFTTTLF